MKYILLGILSSVSSSDLLQSILFSEHPFAEQRRLEHDWSGPCSSVDHTMTATMRNVERSGFLLALTGLHSISYRAAGK